MTHKVQLLNWLLFRLFSLFRLFKLSGLLGRSRDHIHPGLLQLGHTPITNDSHKVTVSVLLIWPYEFDAADCRFKPSFWSLEMIHLTDYCHRFWSSKC